MGVFKDIDICLCELKVIPRDLAVRYLSGDSSAGPDICEHAAEHALDQLEDLEDDLEVIEYIESTYYRR